MSSRRAEAPPGRATMLWRGLRRRCPKCGAGGLFRGYFDMAKVCPACGHEFDCRAEEGFFLGALTINLAITEGFLLLGVFAYIVVLASGDGGIPVLPVTLGAVALAIVLPILFYPFAKSIWAAVELALYSAEDRR